MSISLICACKNRFDSLIISLNSWLKYEQIKEIIIVDWDSDNDLKNILEIDSRIKVIRVNNQPHFNLSQPLNIAASIATQDYILKVDTDYIINPYYNFFDEYKIDETKFVSGIKTVKNPHHWCEENKEYRVKYSESSIEELFNYFCSYSPFFKYVKGLLFVSREKFNSIGGYDESIDSYGWEDDNIIKRLKLLGLEQIKLENDLSIIHIPHSDKKRYENCKEYDPKTEEYYKNNLSMSWTGDDLLWQTEYIIVQDLITKNKRSNDIVDFYIDKKYHWDIVESSKNYYIANSVSNKPKVLTLKVKNPMKKNNLSGLNEVRYISLEESIDRREKLQKQFNNYDVKTIPFISKRFSESNDIIRGNNVYQLNGGTKGCCVSHLKMIKDWYENSDEDYGFFCEDDLSLETVQYWNFTWKEFLKSVPEDADCVQLLTIREDYDSFELRDRIWNDWSATAYILKRSYAKKIVDNHIIDNEYHLYVPNKDIQPLIENIIFNSEGKTYTIPLFVEDINFTSTFDGDDDDVNCGQKNNHFISHEKVLNWWKRKKNMENKLIPMKNKIVDYFIYFNEKELLELRINLLKNYVDEFLIVDADRTHVGDKKSFTCKNTLKELGLWDEDKIKIIELNLHSEYDEVEFNDHDRFYNHNDHKKMIIGSRERIQRDAITKVLDEYSDDTVFIVSDCDEIINPENIEFISKFVREYDLIVKIPLVYLQSRADLRVHDKESDNPFLWDCSMFMTTKLKLKFNTPNNIRSNFNISSNIDYIYQDGKRLEDLGWHFSWMGNSIRQKTKAYSYSHYDHEFDFISYKKCSGEEMDNFIESYVPKEGNVPISGHIGKYMKSYSVDKLPKIIFDLPRVKEFLLPSNQIEILDYAENKIHAKSDIETLLTNFSLDTENPDHNFNLGLWYEERKHTAPALSYFLRCAERAADIDKDLAYESLLHASHCYDRQGTRDGSARSLLWQAQMFLPNRPEAYYLLARFARKKEWWQDCYTNSDLCLRYCDFTVAPLKTYVEYPGKYGILFEKAVSGWWWGKAEESKSLLQEILVNYDLENSDYEIVCDELEKIGGEIPKNCRRELK